MVNAPCHPSSSCHLIHPIHANLRFPSSFSAQSIEEAEDIRKEVASLRLLSPHPSIVELRDTFEDERVWDKRRRWDVVRGPPSPSLCPEFTPSSSLHTLLSSAESALVSISRRLSVTESLADSWPCCYRFSIAALSSSFLLPLFSSLPSLLLPIPLPPRLGNAAML